MVLRFVCATLEFIATDNEAIKIAFFASSLILKINLVIMRARFTFA